MSDNAPRTSSNQTEDWGGPAGPAGPGDPNSTGAGDGDKPLLDRLADRLPYWLTWRETFLGGIVGIALLVIVVLVLAFVTTFLDATSLSGTLGNVESTRASDTYEGWLGSYQSADRAARDTPGGIRSFFHTLGIVVPGASPYSLRRDLERERAYAASVLEYRFETDGSRGADHLGWAAFDEEAMTPLSAASHTYRLLTRGELGRAVSVSTEARESFQESRAVLRAHLEALLAAGLPDEAAAAAAALEEAGVNGAYDGYLLARAAAYRSGQTRSKSLSSFVDGEGSKHLGALIARTAAVAANGQGERALSIGRRLLKRVSKSTAPYQKSKLHNAMGDAHAAAGNADRAQTSYGKAIEILGKRTSVYLPLIDHLIERGELEKAREQVDTAARRAGSTSELQLRRAHIAFFQGRFDEALSMLDEVSAEVDIAPLLAARVLIADGDFAGAKERLDGIPDNHPERPSVVALTQIVAAATSSEVSDSTLAKVDELASKYGDNPVVLRSAAKVRLRAARNRPAGDREKLLEKARTHLESARELQPRRALNDFLLCEAYRLEENAEEANEHCDKAREQNDAYLPGMLTAARLEFLEQTPTDAALLLARLTGAFDDSWNVAKLRIRALLRSHRPESAADLLAAWRARPVSKTAEFELFEGHVAFFRGDYEGALDHYEGARESETYADEARLYTAHSAVRVGDFERAEGIVNKLKEKERWSAAAWTIFGELRLRQEDKTLDAIENLRIASRHYDRDTAPRWRLAHLNGQRALAWRDHRDWNDTRVERYLDRGRTRGDPNSPEILLPLGLYYLQVPGTANDPDRAVELLERVVEIQPYRCEAIVALHEAYEETHDYEGIERMESMKEKECK